MSSSAHEEGLQYPLEKCLIPLPKSHHSLSLPCTQENLKDEMTIYFTTRATEEAKREAGKSKKKSKFSSAQQT